MYYVQRIATNNNVKCKNKIDFEKKVRQFYQDRVMYKF